MSEAHAPDPRPPGKLLGSSTVKLRLAAASLLILGVGALLAPRARPTALSAPQERAAPLLLEEQVQRDVPPPFRGVQEVAVRVREHVVAIGQRLPPAVPTRNDFAELRHRPPFAGAGVLVGDSQVLTHALALDGQSSVQISTADGRLVAAQVVAYESSTGLVLLNAASAVGQTPRFAGEPPAPGALLVAAGRWDGRNLAVPAFVTSVGADRYTVGATEGPLLPGMPLYTLEGELLAITVGEARRGEALPAREAVARLTALVATGERRGSFGLTLQELTGDLTRAFGDRGVLISDVVPGGPADLAGVRPGDALLAIAGAEVDSADMAVRSLGAARVGTPAALRLLRGGQARTIEVTPATAYDVAARGRDGSDRDPPGVDAGALLPAPLLEALAIPPASRVLTINGRAVPSRDAERELGRRTRRILLLRHEGNQFFAVLETPR